MNRPWIIWSVLGACALLIVGAMAWSTNKAIQLERKQALAESGIELEERIRMSLSRMDAAASGFLILENQRPLHHYEAFFEPEDVLTNQFQVVGKGFVFQPSPLLPELPEFVRLHFEIDAVTGEVTSPQVPVGNEWDYAEQNGVQRDYLDDNKRELSTLQDLLAQPSKSSLANGGTKLDLLCRVCARVDEAMVSRNWAWNIPDSFTVRQKEQEVAHARANNEVSRSQQDPKDLALIEKKKRAELYQDTSQRAVPKPQALQNFLPQSEQARSTSLRGGELEQDAEQSESGGVTDPKQEERRKVVRRTGPIAAGQRERAAVEGESDQVGDVSRLVELPSETTPFHPIWLGEDLFIVREVAVAGSLRHQGVWLKAEVLADHLLGVIEHLLPEAGLEPLLEISASSPAGVFDPRLDELSNDPLSLVTLPWRLQAGEDPVMAGIGWSALRISLMAGWVTLLLALLASAALMGGVVKLSERRAAFVSSVTHELRTPLTTFHLYSDMLAEGMVKEESRQKEYLTTMRREAERLNHLVENVLSYSRVERGSARAEHQKITLQGLVDRMLPRLKERVRKDGAELEVILTQVEEAQVDTDLTAVEQIVFNLVDNACKYGLPEEGARVIRLRASNGGRLARIEICDGGSGIARSDVKKLFRPFHKSARDAAHSKPGVGLGLALCKRLAREIGGDLTLDDREAEGACFVLELPAVG